MRIPILSGQVLTPPRGRKRRAMAANGRMSLWDNHKNVIPILPPKLGYLVLNGILHRTFVSQASRKYDRLRPGTFHPVITQVSKTYRVQTDPSHWVSLHILGRSSITRQYPERLSMGTAKSVCLDPNLGSAILLVLLI